MAHVSKVVVVVAVRGGGDIAASVFSFPILI
jgi:hypothetical protein